MYKFIIPLFALAFLLVSCSQPVTTTTDTTPIPSMKEEEMPKEYADALEKARASYTAGQELQGKHIATIKTSKGDIVVELDADAAPKTVTNFVLLAKEGYYDNMLFHRVIPDFMVQAGDPRGDGTGGESIYGPTFEDEINANAYKLNTTKVKDIAPGQDLPAEIADLTVKELYVKQGYIYNDKLTSLPMSRGALAMANRGPATNGSQFFIIQGAETPWLNGKHTVFGKVTKGMDIVDAISKVARDGNDMPTEPVTFSVEVE